MFVSKLNAIKSTYAIKDYMENKTYYAHKGYWVNKFSGLHYVVFTEYF